MTTYILPRCAHLASQRPVASSILVAFIALVCVFDGWYPNAALLDEYNARLPTQNENEAFSRLEEELAAATAQHNSARGFFWGCDDKCIPARRLQNKLSVEHSSALKERNDRIRRAKSVHPPYSKQAFADLHEIAVAKLGEIFIKSVSCTATDIYLRVWPESQPLWRCSTVILPPTVATFSSVFSSS